MRRTVEKLIDLVDEGVLCEVFRQFGNDSFCSMTIGYMSAASYNLEKAKDEFEKLIRLEKMRND